MNLFKRTKRIIQSHMSATLDSMEDPQKMIRYMIRDVEATISDAKVMLAEKLAQQTLLDEEKKEISRTIHRWAQRATLAVEKEREELAKEAISERLKSERKKALLIKEQEQLDQIISHLHSQIATLEEKRNNIREKERLLVQRATHAKEQKKIVKALQEIDSLETRTQIDSLERHIETLEAEVELSTDRKNNEHLFNSMEQQAEIDRELMELKKKRKVKTSE
jgi:phage shock protein A